MTEEKKTHNLYFTFALPESAVDAIEETIKDRIQQFLDSPEFKKATEREIDKAVKSYLSNRFNEYSSSNPIKQHLAGLMESHLKKILGISETEDEQD